jgi:hypothetical protein
VPSLTPFFSPERSCHKILRQGVARINAMTKL